MKLPKNEIPVGGQRLGAQNLDGQIIPYRLLGTAPQHTIPCNTILTPVIKIRQTI